MNLQGFDLGWPQAEFSERDAESAYRGGKSFVFIGRQASNVNAYRQRERCRGAGIARVGEYLESPRGVWPELFPDTKYVAIAVEENSGFDTEWDIDNALLFVRSQDRVPIIYSSAYMWHLLGLDALTKYGDEGTLLWNANYDGRCDGYALNVPFGGWTTCTIDQWTEQGGIAGISYPVDFDECDDALWAPEALSDGGHATWDTPAAPAIPAWVTAALAGDVEVGGMSDVEMVQVKGGESVPIIESAVTAALAKLVSAENVPIHLLIGKNPDGTVRMVLDGMPLHPEFDDIAELQ